MQKMLTVLFLFATFHDLSVIMYQTAYLQCKHTNILTF
uniref:Uncharacterized protein n=1 Tax=Anguilla anguilla TaxID=7936 RepID=A0A0E9UH88_ANGAN